MIFIPFEVTLLTRLILERLTSITPTYILTQKMVHKVVIRQIVKDGKTCCYLKLTQNISKS